MPGSAAKASAKATAGLTPEADSLRWAQGKANQVRIGNLFLSNAATANPELATKWGSDWARIAEEHMTAPELWAHLADFIVHVYTIEDGSVNAGKHLGVDTAVGVWGGLLNQAKTRFSSSASDQTRVCQCCTACLPACLTEHTLPHPSLMHTLASTAHASSPSRPLLLFVLFAELLPVSLRGF